VAVLPAALAATAAAALRRFVLRARVRIDVSPAGAVCLPGGDLPAGAHALRHPSGSMLWWLPAGGAAPADAGAQAARECAELQLGLPTVLPETSGSFVAQMLNLDCIGAIAFDKGCYTGQEVVARAHYRGRVKRRMQRFAAASLPHAPDGGELPPGSALRLADGRSAQLVRSAPQPDGSVQFLAVCAWPPGDEAAGQSAGHGAGDGAGDAASRVDSRPLPLPYPLPQ
jgi:folate-binding protein YgfZ